MLESKLQAKLIKKLTEHGYYVLKLINTNKNWIPDLLALKEWEVPRFIEVKGEKTKLRDIQEYRINELLKHWFDAEVCRGKDGVEKLLKKVILWG